MRLRGRRDSPENRHQYERRAEVGYDGSRVLLQLVIKSSRRKSRDRDVLEGSVVLVISNGIEELVLPCSTSESSTFRKKIIQVSYESHLASCRLVSAVTK